MQNNQNDNKIADVIKTIRTWSLLWNLEELLQEITSSTASIMNVDFAYLLLLENTGLREKARFENKELPPQAILHEIAEKVIRNGTAIYAHDLAQSADSEVQVYCVPMTANRGVLGVLYLVRVNYKSEITANEKLLIEMLGLQAASFLENSILYHSAITDPLTGLISHRHFQQECDQILRRATRTQSCATLMILDLDHFKQLNDKYGHEEGNNCLRRISDILRTSFRVTDIVARFGGDEFEILLPDANTEKCTAIANSLIEAIRNEKFLVQISGTIGIATFPDHAIDSQSLFLAADQALYVGKQNGRNCVTIATSVVAETKQTPTKNTKLKTSIQSSIKDVTPQNAKKDLQKIEGLDIINRIASSSNSEVLLAKQTELDRLVALKRPLTSQLTDEQALAFKREALLTASLSHPGVVPLYTMGQGIDGRLYYTMKPLKGISLEELLKKWKAKDAKTITEYNLFKLIHILMKASETVSYAHNHHVAHLDIHPGNIIIGEFGEITLIDWGKGVNLKESQPTFSHSKVYISGSPIYRAPEQLKSDTVGKFTDVYSLGVILYEILTDKTPFKKDSTKDTIEAIITGADISIEKDEVFQSTDPILVTACKNATNKDPNARITAAELAKLLSRFVMSESESTIYTFLDNTTLDDWHQINASYNKDKFWGFNKGVFFSTTNDQQHIIYWKPFITGNFTFTCEGWITELNRELSLICFGKSIYDTNGWTDRKEIYRGYCFQFGADNNQYTKLARHGDDIMIDAHHRVNLNKKYTLTISYQDGWLRCYIDKELIFTYREHHPFKGYHIGLYSFSEGSYFRPIEIKYEKTSLQIPAIRLADDHLSNGRYDVAIDRYNDIIESFPDRLDGFEAKLKKGYCLAKAGNKAAAIEIFNELKGTILEPYALVERAMIELPENDLEVTRKDGDYHTAYLALKELTEKFPNHQSQYRILYPCLLLKYFRYTNVVSNRKNMQKAIEGKIELFQIGLDTLKPPSQSQIRCFGSMINHMIMIGKWKEAFETLNKYMDLFEPYILSGRVSLTDFMLLFYCTDQWDHPNNKFKHKFESEYLHDLYPILIIHMLDIAHALNQLQSSKISNSWRTLNYKLICQLALKQTPTLIEFSNNYEKRHFTRNQLILHVREVEVYALEMMIAGDLNFAYAEEIFTFLELFLTESAENSREAIHMMSYFKAFKELINLNFEAILEQINYFEAYKFSAYQTQEKKLVLNCLMRSLGYQALYPIEILKEDINIYLSGARLELCTKLLEGNYFEFSDVWSIKPSFCFYDRIIYCVWAIEKNYLDQAHKVLNTLINPKFGNAYFQPYIYKLLDVLAKKRGK